MTQRTLKIGLSSSLADMPVNATIWLNDQIIQDNITVSAVAMNPLLLEHAFDDTISNLYVVKFELNNDYYDVTEDLNLIVNYIALSNADNTFDPYVYLTSTVDSNLRTSDNSYLLTGTVWSNNAPYEMPFDLTNLLTWYDHYQQELDNPPV
jgi:hypothetical protein